MSVSVSVNQCVVIREEEPFRAWTAKDSIEKRSPWKKIDQQAMCEFSPLSISLMTTLEKR